MATSSGRKPKLLNVREHLMNSQEFLEAFQKYGDCPLVRDWAARVSLINRAILRKHAAARAEGNRKDLRVES